METLVNDVRYAFRTLRKSPGFTAAAVLSLALGIGANGAAFSLVDALLLRPLPVEAPDRLVALAVTDHHSDYPHGLSYRDYLDYKEQGDVFDGALAFMPIPLSMSAGSQSELTWGLLVSDDYFSTLGVKPALGRGLAAGGDGGAGPAAVISYKLWQQRFGGDPGVVGRAVNVNGHAFTIAGVTPREFTGLEVIFDPDVYVPASMHAQAVPDSAGLLEDRDAHSFRVWARLKPGVDMEQAQAAVSLRARQLEQAYPDTNRGVDARVFPEWEARFEAGMGSGLALASGVVMALVALVLLVACANVANLLLARMTARRREIAVRLALGAGRWRLLRQLLTEGLVLALLGAAAATVLAYWGADLLRSFRPAGSVPLGLDVRLDGRVLGFTLLLAVLSALAFGVAPALQALGRDLVPSLKGEEAARARRGRRFHLRDVLIVGQVAVSLVLLVCAGLFLRSLGQARSTDLGMRGDGAVLASFDLGLQGYGEQEGRAFYRDLVNRARTLPGVQSASLASPVPLDFSSSTFEVVVEGREAEPGREAVGMAGSVVGADYFEAIGTPVVAGRGFSERDREDAPGVAIVNETFARRYWPGQDPLGRRIRLADGLADAGAKWLEVVGVAKDGKYRMYFEAPQPYVYLPAGQRYRGDMTLVVRTDADPAGVVAALRREVATLDAEVPLFGVRTMEAFLRDRTFAGPRLVSSLLSVFGLLGLTLAAVGIYGVMAYSVGQRTREIGVRMALGARRGDVVAMVLRQGLTLAALGVGAGAVAALAVTRLMSSLLYGVSATDPLTFAGVAALLAAVAVVACLIPARRASRVDPMVALRYE